MALLTSQAALSSSVCLLLLTVVSTRGMGNRKVDNLDIALLVDVSSEAIRQTCNVNPIANISQVRMLVTNHFNSFLHNTSYELRTFSLEYSYNHWSAATTTHFLLQNMHHVVLFWGSDLNARTSGVVANMHSAPVVSLLPVHGWFREGAKLPNVVVPRTGQSLKGIAASDMIRPTTTHWFESCVIFREETASPELEQLLLAVKKDPRVYVYELVLSDQTLQSFASISNDSASYTDTIVVDSDLDVFHFVMLTSIQFNFIKDKTVVIFLHEFNEIRTWESLRVLSARTSYVFAFRQRTPSSSNTSSFENGLVLDALQAIAEAVVSSGYDPNARWIENLVYSSIQFVHQKNLSQFVDAMKQQCVYGYSGNFGFSSGEALDKSCLNKRLVEFDIMRINTTNWKHNGSCQYNWYKYGGWTGTRGLDIPDKLWQFSPNRQQTIQEINILVVPFGPFTYLKPNGEWAGVDIDLLEILSEYAGLTMSQMNFTKWNGSRKEAVQELYRNDRYHLAVGAIIPHASTKGIIYTRSYYDLRLGTVILKRQQNTNLMWRFMEPFHWSVWLATVAVIILGGITSKWLDLAQTYGNGIWVVVCTIFFVQVSIQTYH